MVAGATQYDTGQRLRLRGLPTPDELAEKDDFLSGDVVTVQVQYAYEDESQTENCLATYDESEDAWFVPVPDKYLRRNYPVNFYVFVNYGVSGETSRGETQYEGSFKPKARPAPSDEVTQDQLSAWDVLVQEVNLALSATAEAASRANAAAASAADTTDKWANSTVSAKTLAAGSAATVTKTEKGGVVHLEYGIPAGATGATGPQGPKGDKGDTGPAGVTFSLSGTTLTITMTK